MRLFGNLNKSSRRRMLIIGIVTIALLSVFFLYPLVVRFIVGQHQKSVILELIEWRDDFEEISSEAQAFDAIEMYEYISIYYTAGEGYFSSEKMSSKLEHQRRQSLDTIITSLEDFTGLQYGHDLKRWKEWRELSESKARGTVSEELKVPDSDEDESRRSRDL